MNESDINKNELWKEMMSSMIYFTETSTALINRMQDKLGVPNPIGISQDMQVLDPSEGLKKLQEQIAAFGQNSSDVCRCTSPPSPDEDIYNSDEDITIGIDYYSEPKIVKKKKFKYPPNLETKILAQMQKRSLTCKCEGEGKELYVDTCLCEDISNYPQLQTENEGSFCPVVQCSSLEQSEVHNEPCDKFKKIEITVEEEELPGSEGDAADSLEGILKPGTYDPNELPQDDSNPFILKGPEISKGIENVLGFELYNAMKKFGSNIAQINVQTDEKETYDRFLEKCSLVAVKLKIKIPPQGLLGIFTPNHINSAVPYLAALFNGNRVVSFDSTMNQTELTNCLKNVTPTIMFVWSDSLHLVKDSMEEAGVDFQIVVFGDEEEHETFNSYLENESEEVNEFQVNLGVSVDATAVLCFTSGSTGSEKAVYLSHKALLHQCYQMINAGNIQPVILDFSEMSKMSSVIFLFSSILNGCTRVITESFHPENVKSLVDKYEIKSIYLRPLQCMQLSSYLGANEDITCLFHIFTGGERLSHKVTRRLNEQLIGCLVCQFYENTELGGAVTMIKLIDPSDISMLYCRPQSCGRALEGVWYKVVDIDSGKIVSHSSIGVLHVKSDMISSGYCVNNSEIPHDGEWFNTNDLVYYDQQGRFHFVDRMDNVIKYQDKFIIPSQIEDILLNHDRVEMAVVIGVPDLEDEQVQLVTALVTLSKAEGVTTQELEELVNSQVSDNENLRGGVKIVEIINFTYSGKIKR